MAKEDRYSLTLKCTVCGEENYLTEKNKKNNPERLEVLKYCPVCKKKTLHREKKKQAWTYFFIVMISVKPFIYNTRDELMSNCYVVFDAHKRCMIIDPSCNYDGVVNYVKENKLKPVAILLTHSHYDHIKGVDRIVKAFNIPVYIHEDDYNGLYDPKYNFSYMDDMNVILSSKANKVQDFDSIKGLEEDILVMHTPFHSAGSVCYYLSNNKLLFSGDSLFYRSIGRNDFETSVPGKTRDSLKKIMSLPDDVKVYPGHGIETNIGDERNKNPFVNR